MATPWTTSSVADCLAPVPAAGKTKLQARDYKPAGRFPVVDQGQQRIAGWTDDDTAVIREPLPLIVFGDHTRTFKFIDRPFARGADGTQLLRPKRGIDPLFFFYACKAIDLPARGYNRHFTTLKEQGLSYPGEAEQQAVGSVLRRVDSALEHQTELIAITQALKRAAMRELFARGVRGEPKEESETGLLPGGWKVLRLDACAVVTSTRMSYSDLEATQPSAASDAVPVLGIKVSDMNRPGNEVDLAQAALMVPLDRAIAERRCAPPGTIIFPKRGAAIATNKKRFATAWTVFDPNVIGVRAGVTVNPRFLFHWFQNFDLRTITEPGPTPQLNKKNLDPLLLSLPTDMDEQRDIVAILDAIDRKSDLHQRKRAVLDDLFKALLHKLMTGEITVDELNLSALEGAAAPEGAHA